MKQFLFPVKPLTREGISSRFRLPKPHPAAARQKDSIFSSKARIKTHLSFNVKPYRIRPRPNLRRQREILNRALACKLWLSCLAIHRCYPVNSGLTPGCLAAKRSNYSTVFLSCANGSSGRPLRFFSYTGGKAALGGLVVLQRHLHWMRCRAGHSIRSARLRHEPQRRHPH